MGRVTLERGQAFLRRLAPALAGVLVAAALAGCSSTPRSAGPPGTGEPARATGSAATSSTDDTAPGDIISVLVRDEQLSRLAMLLKGSGLTDLLASGGPYTVFAPGDTAFAEIDPEVRQLVESGRVGWLSPRLRYHVVRGAVPPAELQRSKVLTAVTGDTIAVTVDGGKVRLNDQASVLASHESSSGWVYRIDAVLVPPAR